VNRNGSKVFDLKPYLKSILPIKVKARNCCLVEVPTPVEVPNPVEVPTPVKVPTPVDVPNSVEVNNL